MKVALIYARPEHGTSVVQSTSGKKFDAPNIGFRIQYVDCADLSDALDLARPRPFENFINAIPAYAGEWSGGTLAQFPEHNPPVEGDVRDENPNFFIPVRVPGKNRYKSIDDAIDATRKLFDERPSSSEFEFWICAPVAKVERGEPPVKVTKL